jgi:hypothetical protein
MTFKKVLILATLAAAGVSASAATVTADWGALGPLGAEARGITEVAGDVDDFYSFTLGTGYEVLSVINYYVATNLDGVNTVDLTNAELTLWKGVYGDTTADVAVASEAFGTASTYRTFTNLGAGSYYFEVSGSAGDEGSDYYLNVAANQVTPPSNVPEPANVALLLSGIGLFGIMAMRRKNF